MKYALVNGQRQEARPGLAGECLGCGRPMSAKCGEIKVWHWAHRGERMCDAWWENETEWHRRWKGYFPVEWQEIIHTAESGEKHIADVKTAQGWVLEFQHSFLKPGERQARDFFYPRLVWIVDGTRRKRDQVQFFDALNAGGRVSEKPIVRKIFSDECALLREWAGSQAPIFFDFGEVHRLWWLLPKGPNGKREYVGEFPRPSFIGLHRVGTEQDTQVFEKFLQDFNGLISTRESQLRALSNRPLPNRLPPQRHRRF